MIFLQVIAVYISTLVIQLLFVEGGQSNQTQTLLDEL